MDRGGQSTLKKSCDEKMETSEVQVERIRYQGSRGDSFVQSTVDRVLRARKKMMKNKANGPADCLVTVMLQCLRTETRYEAAYWFEKRFKGKCRAPEAWTILRLVFLKKPNVFSKWYTTVLVDLLQEK